MPTRARQGLETTPKPADREWQFGIARQLIEVNREADSATAKRKLIEALRRVIHDESLTALEDDGIDREYEHFRACISAGQHELENHLRAILVEDIAQRVEVANEIRGVSDPLELIDMMLTTKRERLAFEARRALHIGSQFYEFERKLGTERDLYAILHAFEIALADTLEMQADEIDAVIFHDVATNKAGQMMPLHIRAPRFDGSKDQREKGENRVQVTFRQFGKTPARYALMQERIKSRFSALLKALRKGETMSSLKDPIGIAMFMQSGIESLQWMVQQLESRFELDTSRRDIHPLRQASGGQEGDRLAGNRSRSQHFGVEKMVLRFRPASLLDRSDAVNAVLQRFYSNERNRRAFWERIGRHQGIIPIEIQIGTVEDWLRQHLTGGAEMHQLYKARQAGEPLQGDDTRVALELVAPKRLFGIDWRTSEIEEVLMAKQRAGIGLHHGILEASGST